MIRESIAIIGVVTAAQFGAPSVQHYFEQFIPQDAVVLRPGVAEIQQQGIQSESIQAPELEPLPRGSVDYDVQATAGIAVDVPTGTVLYEKKRDEALPLASITKLMLALVVVDEADMSDVHTVRNPNHTGANMKLQDGEQLTIRNLLHGSLIPSANDASRELARAVAGSEEEMVKKMNQKAQEIGLHQTHFTNVTGLDREDDRSITEENRSTVFELAELLQAALKDPTIRSIVSKKEATVSSIDGAVQHELRSTNQLLGTRGVSGGKTGYTDRAGQSLVVISGHGTHEVITVVLDAEDRFRETARLIDAVEQSIEWIDCEQGKECGILQ